jgi:DNA-binding NtrC family response regulator
VNGETIPVKSQGVGVEMGHLGAAFWKSVAVKCGIIILYTIYMKTTEKTCPVLVVDDDNDLCEIMEAIVRKICPVHSEHDLQSAENYLTRRKPAIIFLDNNLPDGSGVQFIKEILEFYPDIKIVLMTADVSVGLKEKALDEGAIRFIAKPFRSATINELIFAMCPNLHAA